QENAFTDSAAFPVLFTLVVLLVFNPLRTRLQAFVDRVFFRTHYDGAQMLATLGGQLGAAMARDGIGRTVCETVQTAIPNTGTRLFVKDEAGTVAAVGEGTAVPDRLVRRLETGRIVTAFDPLESYAEAEYEA